MTHYLLTIYQPDGGTPPPEFLARVGRDLHALNQEIKAAGAWVFSRGLHAPSTATVVRARGREVLTTDGPYAEGKEHVGGFWIVNARDLDQALDWARKAARATTLPIEVRPFQDVAEH
ncbi:MAG TPA: YciI family protein [Burkholderiaceae bacterium]|nr:YciI family protein [Burkholderiaceae bacterium]